MIEAKRSTQSTYNYPPSGLKPHVYIHNKYVDFIFITKQANLLYL